MHHVQIGRPDVLMLVSQMSKERWPAQESLCVALWRSSFVKMQSRFPETDAISCLQLAISSKITRTTCFFKTLYSSQMEANSLRNWLALH